MTGHCLGAAGSIEAVFSVKAIKENLVPPTIGYSDEDLKVLSEKAGTIDFIPNKSHTKDVHYAMSNSFAFGGNNASIISRTTSMIFPTTVKMKKFTLRAFQSLQAQGLTNTALTATLPPKIMTNTESRLHFTESLTVSASSSF